MKMCYWRGLQQKGLLVVIDLLLVAECCLGDCGFTSAVSCHKDRLCQHGEECNQTGPSAWLHAATPQRRRSVLQLLTLQGENGEPLFETESGCFISNQSQ